MSKPVRIGHSRIVTRPAEGSGYEHAAKAAGIDFLYFVTDGEIDWGVHTTYEAANRRLKVRRGVEKAARTRRANKARREARG